MFNNLMAALKIKNISIRAYSRIIDVKSESSAQNKLRGRTEFTRSEMQKTKEILPEYDINWLFQWFEENPKEAS